MDRIIERKRERERGGGRERERERDSFKDTIKVMTELSLHVT